MLQNLMKFLLVQKTEAQGNTLVLQLQFVLEGFPRFLIRLLDRWIHRRKPQSHGFPGITEASHGPGGRGRRGLRGGHGLHMGRVTLRIPPCGFHRLLGSVFSELLLLCLL